MTEGIIFQHPAGTSRYLYFASAGSSLLLAAGLQRVGLSLGRWGRPLFMAALLLVGSSSYLALGNAEALSIYSSARNYMARGDIATSVQLMENARQRSKKKVATT